MAKRRSSKKFPTLDEEADEDEAPSKDGWKSWVRDIAVAVIIMAVILGAIYAYTGVWPPLVVVESSSMQHSSTESFIGVIDTGDLVFVQRAPTRTDVITYVQGRATGYSTYGDYGDVIIFNLYNNPAATPIIHRAIMYVVPNGSYADVPDLKALPWSDWGGVDASGTPTHFPYHLESVWINNMGYRHLNVSFLFSNIAQFFDRGPGYLTMGDHNAPSYDAEWFPIQSDIIGHARGEIPWFGLIKLLLSPTSECAAYWGDACAPANSWTDLAISLVFLVALPFIMEAAAWAWGKYAWPHLRPLFRRKGAAKEGRKDVPPPEPDEKDSLDELEAFEGGDSPEGPRGGSSGP